MLIFSANPPGTTREHLRWLSENLPVGPPRDDSAWEFYSFPTVNPQGIEGEFWVAGHQLTPEERKSGPPPSEKTGAATGPDV